jgi:hypothetical protein
MKKAAIWTIVVIGLLIAGRLGLGYMFTSGEANTARERVRRILDGLKSGGDRQKAIPLWRHGTFNVGSQHEFDTAAGEFEDWTLKHRIDPVVDYEIREVEVLDETDRLGNATVRVAGTVNGKPFAMRVQQGARVEMEGPNAP